MFIVVSLKFKQKACLKQRLFQFLRKEKNPQLGELEFHTMPLLSYKPT